MTGLDLTLGACCCPWLSTKKIDWSPKKPPCALMLLPSKISMVAAKYPVYFTCPRPTKVTDAAIPTEERTQRTDAATRMCDAACAYVPTPCAEKNAREHTQANKQINK